MTESRSAIRVGIDATNIRMGGGVTHLVETLSNAEPRTAGIAAVTVWAPRATLDQLPVRDWLTPRPHPWLEGPLPSRVAWQTLRLTSAVRAVADVLFVPGGSYAGPFRPFVVVAQSMLPFDDAARRLYPRLSRMRFRNALLHRTQGATMRRADGVIFLTEYDRRVVLQSIGGARGRVTVIPLGSTPGVVKKLSVATSATFKWLYVSTIDRYKHHDSLVAAAAALTRDGHRISLDFIGPENASAARSLEQAMRSHDPGGTVVRKLGSVSGAQLKTMFAAYDGFVFASSCESFGIPLIDALQARLPTACSNLSTMPEVAQDAVEYFNPYDPRSAAEAMRRIMTEPSLRERLAARGPAVASRYDWGASANATMRFLAGVARD